MKSVIKPQYEYVTKEDKPGKIGIQIVGERGTFWFDEPHLRKTIASFDREVAFYNETLGVLMQQSSNIEANARDGDGFKTVEDRAERARFEILAEEEVLF